MIKENKEMGATESVPESSHRSSSIATSNQHRFSRSGLPKIYSLPAHLGSHSSVKEKKFFPPPILHTKSHQLTGNLLDTNTAEATNLGQIMKRHSLPLGHDDKQRKQFVFRKSTPDSSNFRMISCDSMPNEKELSVSEYPSCRNSLSIESESGRQKITAKISLTSSASSGVGSESGEDAETVEERELPQDEETGSEHENENEKPDLVSKWAVELSSTPDIPRHSLDSGTSLDEEEESNDVLGTIDAGSGTENFETVFEEEENSENIRKASQTTNPRKKSVLQHKKSRKYSLTKSFHKLRKRAASLPSAYVGNLLKKSEKPPSRVFGSSYLNREWEIVTVQEMCRRLSLDQLDKVVLPLPDGATSSQILDEAMIRQMVDVLPARAAGYPWVNIYNSEKHGFSLHTFYRKMIDWNEEMSPVLLIIRDCEGNVFGAIVSTTLRPCDHFFGTGDSCLLFKYVNDPEMNEKELRTYPWSGQNQFFVKASVDSLSVGASGGHYGLWLDADLNHGRTQPCETFQNEQLAGENEDFTIQFVEAFGFRMA